MALGENNIMKYVLKTDAEFEAKLAELANKKGLSIAEILRRALATYSYLQDEIGDGDEKKVSITDHGDEVLKDIKLP